MADFFRTNRQPAATPRVDGPRLVATLPVGDVAGVHEHVRGLVATAQARTALAEALRGRITRALPTPDTLEERVRAGHSRLATERLVQEEQSGARHLELAQRFALRVGQR
ncbi:MAG: hypothetical protein V4850_08645 [Myxococcota bacterium]